MLLKQFLLVFVVTSTVQCEQPKPCCFPEKWEATEALFAGSFIQGVMTITTGNVQQVYDATGKRVYGVATIHIGNIVQQNTFLQLYNKGVQYSIVNNICTSSQLDAWNNRNCIQENATFVSQYRLGLNQSIIVNDFSYNTGAVANVITVINGTCVPVVTERFGPMNGVDVMVSAGIQGATPGITDESVFDVPKICITDDEESKKDLTFSRASSEQNWHNSMTLLAFVTSATLRNMM